MKKLALDKPDKSQVRAVFQRLNTTRIPRSQLFTLLSYKFADFNRKRIVMRAVKAWKLGKLARFSAPAQQGVAQSA